MPKSTAKLTDVLIERTRASPPLPHPHLHALRIHFGKLTKAWKLQADRTKGGKRTTFKRTLGHYPEMKMEAALAAALAAKGAIRAGRDPRDATASKALTLGQAFERFQQRKDRAPRTVEEAAGNYRRCLASLGDRPLKDLGEQPTLARQLHERLTVTKGKVQANHALRLLRAVYRYQARDDRSLDAGKHPCTSVEWNKEKAAQRAIPFAEMPAWAAQVAALKNPLRRAFQRLCLFTGARPGELTGALAEDVADDVLVLRDTKTAPVVEIPITEQIARELAALREARVAMGMAGSRFLFPAESECGYITEWREKREVLRYWGNSGRHSFKTIATALNVSDIISDILQGRQLQRHGMAGRGYINKAELGPTLRAAAMRISAEIDRLLGAG